MSAWSLKNKKNLGIVIFINRKCLKASSSIKLKNNQTFSKKEYVFICSFWIYILVLVIFFVLYISTKFTNMGWPEKQKAARHSLFLEWKKQIPWNKPITKAMTVSQKLQALEFGSITWLVLLCTPTCPFGLWIYCGSVAQSFTEKWLCRSVCWHSMCLAKR